MISKTIHSQAEAQRLIDLLQYHNVDFTFSYTSEYDLSSGWQRKWVFTFRAEEVTDLLLSEYALRLSESTVSDFGMYGSGVRPSDA